MICNHLTELPSQVLTNRLCCVLNYDPSLYWQKENISINANSGGDVRLNSATVTNTIRLLEFVALNSILLYNE